MMSAISSSNRAPLAALAQGLCRSYVGRLQEIRREDAAISTWHRAEGVVPLKEGSPIEIASGYHDFQGRWVEVPRSTIDQVREVMAEDRPGGPLVVRSGEAFSFDEPVEILLEDGGVLEDVRSLPPDMPCGYHRISGTRDLIVGPSSCYLPDDLRTWGWALQLYGMWSETSWGIGDLSDLASFGRWATEDGASLALINPLHAALPTEPYENSPYYPSSRCFLDPLYLDVEAMAELDPAVRNNGRRLNEGERVDRDAVRSTKFAVLEEVWAASPALDEAGRYLEERGPALEGFATYCYLAELHGHDWREWPAGLQHPDNKAVIEERRAGRERVLFHAWVQHLLDEQLRAAGETIGVVNDLAIGVAPSGADAWLWQDSFATGVSIGAPPDDYNLEGQNWGILGFDPVGLRLHGYRPFIEMVRASMRHAAGIRFDHVMGLFRLFWIPEGVEAKDGVYVRYPSDDLITILALESQRAHALVIGEDLGTVEDGVREEMQRRQMLSYRLLWFLDHDLRDLPSLSMASANTHDLPTTRGLWEGSDLERQREMGLDPATDFAENMISRIQRHLGIPRRTDTADLVDASARALATCNSCIVTIAIDDVAGTVDRYNYPGTSGDVNWSTRLPLTLEELEGLPQAKRIADWMREAGR